MPPVPPPSTKTCDGPVHKVPCPHCGKPNDLRDLQRDVGESFEPGLTYECDSCRLINHITSVTPVLVVRVRQG